MQIGVPYISRAFLGIWVIIQDRADENELKVMITSPTGCWSEDWNREHTKAGFLNGTYAPYRACDPSITTDVITSASYFGELIVCPTQLLHPSAQPPIASDEKAMGYDITTVAGLAGLENLAGWDDAQLAAWLNFEKDGKLVLPANESFLFRTGFRQAIHPGWGCLLWDRSGMGGKKLIHRFAGVIDENYRGEWFVRLFNFNKQAQVILPGDRIVQGIYQRRVRAMCPIVTELDTTDRSAKGFGSTGA